MDPAAYKGRTIRVRGLYGSLTHVVEEYFRLVQGDMYARAAFGRLPGEQKLMVLRESEARNCTVVVEGTVKCDGSIPWITAANVTIDGLQPSSPRRA